MTVKELVKNLDNEHNVAFRVYDKIYSNKLSRYGWYDRYFDFKKQVVEKFGNREVNSWEIIWDDAILELWLKQEEK